jgi:hypothetical protein
MPTAQVTYTGIQLVECGSCHSNFTLSDDNSLLTILTRFPNIRMDFGCPECHRLNRILIDSNRWTD